MPENNDSWRGLPSWATRLPLHVPPDPSSLSEELIDSARAELSTFVLDYAEELRADLGFGWQIVADTGEKTCCDWTALFGRSVARKVPLPIPRLESSLNSFDSIVGEAMSFIFIVTMIRNDCWNVLTGDLETGLAVLVEAELADLSMLAFNFLEADLLGVPLARLVIGRPPLDVDHFVLSCVMLGVVDALILEEAQEVVS